MSKKKIYLAGAMGCYKDCPEKAKGWRRYVEDYLYMHGLENEWELFDPTNYYNYWNPTHKTEKEIMRYEFNQIKQSNIVLANLKDINKSLGTSDEIILSFVSGVPVIGFLDDVDNTDMVHPWKIEQIDRIETGKHALENALDYIFSYYS